MGMIIREVANVTITGASEVSGIITSTLAQQGYDVKVHPIFNKDGMWTGDSLAVLRNEKVEGGMDNGSRR